MKYEPPKTQHNVSDKDLNQENELPSLAYALFHNNADGVRFLELLKKMLVSNRFSASIFPITPQILSQFGSTEAYCGFKSGRENVVFMIEEWIESYKQEQINAKK